MIGAIVRTLLLNITSLTAVLLLLVIGLWVIIYRILFDKDERGCRRLRSVITCWGRYRAKPQQHQKQSFRHTRGRPRRPVGTPRDLPSMAQKRRSSRVRSSP